MLYAQNGGALCTTLCDLVGDAWAMRARWVLTGLLHTVALYTVADPLRPLFWAAPSARHHPCPAGLVYHSVIVLICVCIHSAASPSHHPRPAGLAVAAEGWVSHV